MSVPLRSRPPPPVGVPMGVETLLPPGELVALTWPLPSFGMRSARGDRLSSLVLDWTAGDDEEEEDVMAPRVSSMLEELALDERDIEGRRGRMEEEDDAEAEAAAEAEIAAEAAGRLRTGRYE